MPDSNRTMQLLSRAGMLAVLLVLLGVSIKTSAFSVPDSVLNKVTSEANEDAENDADTSEEEEEVQTAADGSAILAITGDFMMHEAVYTTAYSSTTGSYDFTQFFTYAGSWLTDADLTIGNLETTLAGKVNGYPSFSGPDELATDLLTLGFDLVTTANNHCMDQGSSGLLRTLEVLDAAGLDHIGTYASQEEFDENMGIVVEEVNGITIAFLDYTYGTNYVTVSSDYMVNRYNSTTADESEAYAKLDTDKLDAEMAYARSLGTDLIIVMIHWGTEYVTTQSSYQEEIADYLIANGADAVLGGHSHVLQPMEYRTVTDIDGNQKTGFVCYSLGNLISNMSASNTYYTAILNLEITRVDGVTSITGVSYEPMYLINPGNSGLSTLALLDIPAVLADYESGTENPYVTESMYTTLQNAMTSIANILGEDWDISYDVLDTSSYVKGVAQASDGLSVTHKTE